MCFAANSTTLRILPQNERTARVRNPAGAAGDHINRKISDAIENCVDLLDPQAGETILDVATGTGWTARRMALRNAAVTAIDSSEDAVSAACELDETSAIDFQVGDVEALPCGDAEFDAVISTFGVMFCGNPRKAAAELARVCKPGGRLALAIWDDYGGIYGIIQQLSTYKPELSQPDSSPFEWADENRLQEWLGGAFELNIHRGISIFREQSASDAWETFATGYGPIRTLTATLDPPQVAAFRRDFIAFHEQYETPTGMQLPHPYLIVTGAKKS